jgi:hypothetical protein
MAHVLHACDGGGHGIIIGDITLEETNSISIQRRCVGSRSNEGSHGIATVLKFPGDGATHHSSGSGHQYRSALSSGRAFGHAIVEVCHMAVMIPRLRTRTEGVAFQ